MGRRGGDGEGLVVRTALNFTGNYVRITTQALKTLSEVVTKLSTGFGAGRRLLLGGVEYVCFCVSPGVMVCRWVLFGNFYGACFDANLTRLLVLGTR